MATPDIRNQIVNQTVSQTEKAQAPKDDITKFLPQLPSSVVNTNVPQAVLDSISQTTQLSNKVIENERKRIDDTLVATRQANATISDASSKLSEANSSILREFQGIFDSDYNKNYQKSRIETAKQGLANKTKMLELERTKEALDVQQAGLPLTMYKTVTDIQMQQATLSAQEANAIVQSNAAKDSWRKMAKLAYTPEQLDTMWKAKKGDAIWTLQEIQTYQNDLSKAALDLEAVDLANKSKRFELTTKFEERALSQIPLTWANWAIDNAVKNKQPLVTIPNTKMQVPVDKLQKIVSGRMKEQQEAYIQQSKNFEALNINDPVFTSAMHSVSSVSSIFSGDGAAMPNLGDINLLNITPENIEEFPMNSIHPSLRSDMYKVLATAASLNERGKTKYDENGNPLPRDLITPQDIIHFKEEVKTLNTKAADLQKQILESSANKTTKSAYQEWFTNGKIQNQDNASSLIVDNSLSLPNLENDPALGASYQVMMDNIYNVISGDKVDLTEAAPEERQRIIFQALLESGFKGKMTSREIVMKALNAKNAKGVTPISAYVGNRSQELLVQGLNKLGDQYPEFKDYFTQIGKTSGYRNQALIASSLAELSHRMRAKDTNIPELSLNNAFLEIITNLIDQSKTVWNAQINPVRGSLMTLMFSGQPSQIVDDAFSSNFGQASRAAWNELNKIQEDIERMPVSPTSDVSHMFNTTELSPVPLPIK